ncbi:hypothetical protein Tco_1160231 [Tanacetum coccineum]
MTNHLNLFSMKKTSHLGNPLFSNWTELQDKESRAMMQSLERKKDSKARMKSSLLLTEETQAQELEPSPFSYKYRALELT